MGEPLRPPHTRGPAQVFQSLFSRQHPLQHPLFGEKWENPWARAGTGAPK